MKHYCVEKELVLQETNSSQEGLSVPEAERRLQENGRNKLAEGKKKSLQ